MKKVVVEFGHALDNDDFERAKSLLAQDCKYFIGNEILIGPDAICRSYEKNMLEGRKKLDSLVWGDSHVEKISDNEYYIHFTDFLTHKGNRHIFSCKQRIIINSNGKIYHIEHLDDPVEKDRLNDFYRQVGLQ